MRGSGGSAFCYREGLRDERELHALAAADDRQAGKEERVRVERHVSDGHTRHRHRVSGNADDDENEAWQWKSRRGA